MGAWHKESVVHVRFAKTDSRDVDVCRNRILFMAGLSAFLFVCIGIRTVRVSVSDTPVVRRSFFPEEEAYGAKRRRKSVVDQDGKILAVNLSTSSLYANPRKMQNKADAARRLAAVLPSLRREELSELFKKDKGFVWIKRHLTPKERNAVNNVGIPGVYFRDDEQRVYPYKSLFSHVLGYVDVDGRGISGAERHYDAYLGATPNDGGRLDLSLETAVQHAARSALEAAIAKHDAIGGCALVTNARTGEILALVSLPDFDPNMPGEAEERQRFNMAALGVYELGSVFKIFNSALGLEAGAIDMTRKVDVTEPLRIGRYTIRDYHPAKRPMNLEEIFMESSNIGSAKIALDVAPETQRGFLRSLGLFERLGVELPERGEPRFPGTWGKVYQATVAYGHGIAVTPLHLAQAVGAMVNGGHLYPLTLTRQLDGARRKGSRVISEETSDHIRRMMRLTVEFGTGKNADVPHYLVGGKTGTADKPQGGGYGKRKILASFVGAFPMDAPRYIVYVVADEPKSKDGVIATGGSVAAPAAHEIIRRIAPILGVPPADESDYEVRRQFEYETEKEGDGRA
jgi:cell division protein FtsI (penicillin-binding protein 3)